MLSSLPPRSLRPRLIESTSPDEPAPSLHHHPSEQRASQLIRAGPPASAATGTQCLRFLPLARSLSPPVVLTRRPGRPLSTLAFSRSVQEPQTRLTPPLRRAPPGQQHGHPPDSSRGRSSPRFRCHLNRFDASTTTPDPSTSPDRAILERLPGPHLTRSSRAFSPNAHHDGLQPTQHQGGLTPTPAGPTPEGQQSSISRTAPLYEDCFLHQPPSAFVTHGPPGSRAWRSAHAQVLRPRGVRRRLAKTPPTVLPSASYDSVGTPNLAFRGSIAQPARPLPTLRCALADADAWLGATVVRYSFDVERSHLLLHAGLSRRFP